MKLEVYLHPDNEAHKIWNDGQVSVVVTMDDEMFDYLVTACIKEREQIKRLHAGDSVASRNLLKRILHEAERGCNERE